jgi:hypothetical protein
LCHSTATWAGVTLTTASLSHFNHDHTGFKLTGKHKTTDCKSCHINNVFKGTAKTCVACHAEPTVHLGKFGTNCSFCHSTTTWAGATLTTASLKNFDHDKTGFKLTGKHKGVDCKDCHVNNVFKGTSQACVSCHAEPFVPTVHKFRYGSGCANCHTTAGWEGTTFKHDIFSITHGRRNNTCATCHQDAKTFAVYTCYNCHEHTPAKEERRHARRNIVKLDNCIECHGRKRGRPRAEAAPVEPLLHALLQAAPADHPCRGQAPCQGHDFDVLCSALRLSTTHDGTGRVAGAEASQSLGEPAANGRCSRGLEDSAPAPMGFWSPSEWLLRKGDFTLPSRQVGFGGMVRQ